MLFRRQATGTADRAHGAETHSLISRQSSDYCRSRTEPASPLNRIIGACLPPNNGLATALLRLRATCGPLTLPPNADHDIGLAYRYCFWTLPLRIGGESWFFPQTRLASRSYCLENHAGFCNGYIGRTASLFSSSFDCRQVKLLLLCEATPKNDISV